MRSARNVLPKHDELFSLISACYAGAACPTIAASGFATAFDKAPHNLLSLNRSTLNIDPNVLLGLSLYFTTPSICLHSLHPVLAAVPRRTVPAPVLFSQMLMSFLLLFLSPPTFSPKIALFTENNE